MRQRELLEHEIREYGKEPSESNWLIIQEILNEVLWPLDNPDDDEPRETLFKFRVDE